MRASAKARLVGAFAASWIRALAFTVRFELRTPATGPTLPPDEPTIFTVWHNRLALSPVIYRRVVRPGRPDRRLAALVSASRDGALLSNVLERFDVQPVRGSSSRRGAQALLELTTWLAKGFDVAITPDGPRGPRYAVQDGPVALAQATGLLIVPVSVEFSRKIELKSWDRFQAPLPFCRCTVTMDRALPVPRDATAAEREAIRQSLEDHMRRANQDA